MINILKKAKKIIDPCLLWFSMAIMAFMATLMLCQVVARSVFGSSIYWAEETLRLSQIWVTFLVAPLVLDRADHPGFKAFPNRMPDGGKKAVWIVSNAMVALVGWWLFYYGIQLCKTSTYISAIGIPRFVFVWPAVICGIYSTAIAVMKIVQIIRLTPEGVKAWKA